VIRYTSAKGTKKAALDRRHKLEELLNEVLGWHGLGRCTGGSLGPGNGIEVDCVVVDFAIAKQVVAAALQGTSFGDWKDIVTA
jgi:hypothetical protein